MASYVIPRRFIDEVARVLRPGGRFVLIDNVSPEQEGLADFVNLVEQIRDPSHVRCLPITEWTSLLTDARLSITGSRVRKKQVPFQSWVNRMAPTDAQVASAEASLRLAPDDAYHYFDVHVNGNHVESWTIDEWMVIAVRV